MTSETTHVVKRDGWPSGPWDSEPDKAQWTTGVGLPGLIVRNDRGALCGYAGVPKGHPVYEMKYGEVEERFSISAHGGLTYSNHCQDDGGPICHIPAPGEPDDVWWLGFDCSHASDLEPDSMARFPRPTYPGETYRDMAYVRHQVERLAADLAAITPEQRAVPVV